MTQLLALVASELRERAERSNSTFSITDRALMKKLNLGKRDRMRVRYYVSKIPDAEIWKYSSVKTTFILSFLLGVPFIDIVSQCSSSASPKLLLSVLVSFLIGR